MGEVGDPVDQGGPERHRQAGERQDRQHRHHRYGDSPSWDPPLLKGHHQRVQDHGHEPCQHQNEHDVTQPVGELGYHVDAYHHGYGGEDRRQGNPLLPRDLKEAGSPRAVGGRRGDGHVFSRHDHYHGLAGQPWTDDSGAPPAMGRQPAAPASNGINSETTKQRRQVMIVAAEQLVLAVGPQRPATPWVLAEVRPRSEGGALGARTRSRAMDALGAFTRPAPELPRAGERYEHRATR